MSLLAVLRVLAPPPPLRKRTTTRPTMFNPKVSFSLRVESEISLGKERRGSQGQLKDKELDLFFSPPPQLSASLSLLRSFLPSFPSTSGSDFSLWMASWSRQAWFITSTVKIHKPKAVKCSTTVICYGSPLRDHWVRNAHTHSHTHTLPRQNPFTLFLLLLGSLLPLLFNSSYVCVIVCVTMACVCFVSCRLTKTSCHPEWWSPGWFPEDPISHLPLQILAGRSPEDEALQWVTRADTKKTLTDFQAATGNLKFKHIWMY